MTSDPILQPRTTHETGDLHRRLQLANKLFEMLHRPYFHEHTKAAISDLYQVHQRLLASRLTGVPR